MTPEIRTEKLLTFPDIVLPLNLPPPPPALAALALLAPPSDDDVDSDAPWSPQPAPRRAAWLLDVLVVLIVAGFVMSKTSLASHRLVRPYAQVVTTTAERGWHSAGQALQRSTDFVSARTRAAIF